jgi:hypothetical protein
MDSDITSLMMPMLSGGGKDKFGKEKEKRRCLLLDKVMDDIPLPFTESALLDLPSELLGDIADLLDDASLAAFALVNTICRQIARSCQFAEVSFDYSSQAHQLLLQLLKEATARTQGLQETPSIGACIRRIVVKASCANVANRHFHLYDSIFGDGRESCTKEQRDHLLKQANNDYITYRQALLLVISNAIPHLESLAWYDRFAVGSEFFKIITRIPIRHLKLDRLPIDKPYLMEPPLTPSPIPLRSLYLGVSLSWWEGNQSDDERDMSVFAASLLKQCAPTLQTLVWSVFATHKRESLSFGPDHLSFPRMRTLHLQFLKLTEETISCLLQAPLRYLSLKYMRWEHVCKTLGTCELQQLETLETPMLSAPQSGRAPDEADLVTFLENHNHLRKINLGQIPTSVLDNQIIPIFVRARFTNLTSLAKSWEGPGVCFSALHHSYCSC